MKKTKNLINKAFVLYFSLLIIGSGMIVAFYKLENDNEILNINNDSINSSELDFNKQEIISMSSQIIDEIPAPWGSIYGCGDRLCHQKAERSFFINENQMPFCVRCTAIWLGLAIGLGFLVFYKIELNAKFIIVILIGLLPIGIDGLGQLFGFWESTNLVRLITGLLIGFVCGVAIGLIIDEVRDFKKRRI